MNDGTLHHIIRRNVENTRQKRILERVKEVFARLGYAVTLLPIEKVA